MAGTRWWAPAIALLAVVLAPSAMLGGCTLLTSLDDLSGGADDTPDSALQSTPPCSTCDGGVAVGVDGAGGGDTSPPVDGAFTVKDAATERGQWRSRIGLETARCSRKILIAARSLKRRAA
jgi:hypothetical protein